jgi:hypothetical protein
MNKKDWDRDYDAAMRRRELAKKAEAICPPHQGDPCVYCGDRATTPVEMTVGEMYVAVDALKAHLVDIKRAFGAGSLQVANAESLLAKLTALGAGSS